MTNTTLPKPECDLVISGGRVLDLYTASGVLDDMAIAVRDGVIVGMATAREIEASFTPARVIDATGQVVAPGFVDAHVHLGAFLGAGRPYEPNTGPGLFSGGGRPEVVVPMVARMVSASVPGEVVAAVVRPVLAAMLRAGFTAAVDAGGPGVDGVVAAAADLGIRAAIGPSLADLWHDEHGQLVRQADTERLLDEARAAVDRHDQAGHGRVRAVVSGVETMACSDQLLAGIAELAASRGVPTHIHTHITDASVRAHDAAFGRTATRRLADSGMLNSRCTLIHAASLTDDDIAVFAETGVTVNHNPSGNAMLGFGTTAGRSDASAARRGRARRPGQRLRPVHGVHPFEMVRAALMLQRDVVGADNALTIEQALAMASTHTRST